MVAVSSLKSRNDFLRARHSGVFFATHYFTLQLIDIVHSPNQVPNESTFLGLTVSKKIGNAVKRNRVKRRLRHGALDYLGVNGLVNVAYIFIAKPSVINLSWQELLIKIKTATDSVNKKYINKQR